MKTLALIATMLIAGPSLAFAQPMADPTSLSTTSAQQGQPAIEENFVSDFQYPATLSSRELNALRIGAEQEEDVED
jgi:hypothetical protein